MKKSVSLLSLLLAALLAGPAAAGEQVDINSADAATLDRVLDGVGPSKAEAIVAHREQHGAFRSIDELADVKGIGLATIEQNRDRITVGASDAGLLAWVLLPDQWQALVRLGESAGLATVVGRFKAASSRVVGERHRINGWLWGRGFNDRLLAPGEDVAAVAADLFAQPLQRGLVARVDDYAYWHAAWRR
jgi:competence protein ComEA